MNNNLQAWFDNEVYPHIFKYADKIFTEHNFTKKDEVWHSNTYIDGTPHSRKDKVWISADAPYCINEQGGDNLNFFDYFKKYHKMTDKQVIEYFIEITESLPNNNYEYKKKSFDNSSKTISQKKQNYYYTPDNTNIYRFEDFELEERQCFLNYKCGLTDYKACNVILNEYPNAKKVRVFRVAVNKRVVNKNCNPKTFKPYKYHYSLTKYWQNYYLTLCELTDEIKKGHPIVFSHLKQKSDDEFIHRQNNNFECSELFALDMDGTMSIEDALSKELTQKGLFIYTSCNHQSESHRFRLVFELPFLITDIKLYSEIVTRFIEEYNSDPTTKDACRAFYGNTNAKIFILSNTIYKECL